MNTRSMMLLSVMVAASGPVAAQQLIPSTLTAVRKGPSKVQLQWSTASGAKGYKILRASGSSTLAAINTDLVTGTTYPDDNAPSTAEFRYRIRALYANGTSSTWSPLAVVPASPGNVASTTPSSSAQVPSNPVTTAVLATPWQAAPVELAPVELKPVATAPQNVAPAAPPPAAVSGRYRIVANGFSVIHETYDDVLSRDGKFDEVYGGFVALHYDRKTGNLLDQSLRRTKTLGDVANFPDRLRAGSGNGPDGTGGLKAGDSYPDAGHARSRGADGAQPNDLTFPFKVWEGTLTDGGDAAVILPTMWERDEDAGYFDVWQHEEAGKASQIWWDPAVQETLKHTSLGVIAPPGSTSPNPDPDFGTKFAVFLASSQFWMLGVFLAPSHDQPIGTGSMAGGGLPRRAIVLTREIVEQALNAPPAVPSLAAMPPGYPWLLAYFSVPVGVIPVLLLDGGQPNQAAAYVLYLQVERL
ncbi:MAG: hypothetical protein ACJ8BF_06580 [Gemmatimonadales bacterium]